MADDKPVVIDFDFQTSKAAKGFVSLQNNFISLVQQEKQALAEQSKMFMGIKSASDDIYKKTTENVNILQKQMSMAINTGSFKEAEGMFNQLKDAKVKKLVSELDRLTIKGFPTVAEQLKTITEVEKKKAEITASTFQKELKKGTSFGEMKEKFSPSQLESKLTNALSALPFGIGAAISIAMAAVQQKMKINMETSQTMSPFYGKGLKVSGANTLHNQLQLADEFSTIVGREKQAELIKELGVAGIGVKEGGGLNPTAIESSMEMANMARYGMNISAGQSVALMESFKNFKLEGKEAKKTFEDIYNAQAKTNLGSEEFVATITSMSDRLGILNVQIPDVAKGLAQIDMLQTKNMTLSAKQKAQVTIGAIQAFAGPSLGIKAMFGQQMLNGKGSAAEAIEAFEGEKDFGKKANMALQFIKKFSGGLNNPNSRLMAKEIMQNVFGMDEMTTKTFATEEGMRAFQAVHEGTATAEQKRDYDKILKLAQESAKAQIGPLVAMQNTLEQILLLLNSGVNALISGFGFLLKGLGGQLMSKPMISAGEALQSMGGGQSIEGLAKEFSDLQKAIKKQYGVDDNKPVETPETPETPTIKGQHSSRSRGLSAATQSAIIAPVVGTAIAAQKTAPIAVNIYMYGDINKEQTMRKFAKEVQNAVSKSTAVQTGVTPA